ncbi:hypothetical protein SBRY_90037 [Actinacidiphila bryophytorum]|uniref:Uncharacterized protein n=1 Tax=Actinacidiphila bryophytorum TaxID=1436133 RepID=A0A9W4H8D6_9ACTN|nr:hypothetical protein SBRY_90037 [Actinacidiphila bryophytorum]
MLGRRGTGPGNGVPGDARRGHPAHTACDTRGHLRPRPGRRPAAYRAGPRRAGARARLRRLQLGGRRARLRPVTPAGARGRRRPVLACDRRRPQEPLTPSPRGHPCPAPHSPWRHSKGSCWRAQAPARTSTSTATSSTPTSRPWATSRWPCWRPAGASSGSSASRSTTPRSPWPARPAR